MKKLVLQMEKQKVLYEEKALAALQKATQDKSEAVGKAATLQVKGISTSETMFRSLYVCIILHMNWSRLHTYTREQICTFNVFVPIRKR